MMTNIEITSMIVKILLTLRVLALIAIAIYQLKEFFRTIFIDFSLSILKETWNKVISLFTLIMSPFARIFFSTQKRRVLDEQIK